MNSMFPSVNADYYISSNISSDFKTKPRTLRSYELELYTTENSESFVNGEGFRQKSGNVLVAKPGDVRYSVGAFECYYLHFTCHDDDICSMLADLPTVFPASDTDALTEIFKSAVSARKNFDRPAAELYLQGKLAELISTLVYGHRNRHNKYAEYTPALKLVCDYMKEHLDSPIVLADLAALANLSPGFFHKVFKSSKGMTPARYLLALRMRKAKDLLTQTNTALSEIALSCGFGSQSYFNYIFSKSTALTPKQYRLKRRIII